MIITTPDGIQIECGLRFEFQASNNEAEYKVILARLQLANILRAQQLRVFSNSQLVVNQVLHQYEAKEDNIIAYLALIRQILGKLKVLSIAQIPREKNAKADKLACLVSSLEADLQGIRVEYLLEPSIAHQEGIEADEVDLSPSLDRPYYRLPEYRGTPSRQGRGKAY